MRFNRLLTITNMPISRFGAVLLAHNQFNDYMQLLRDNYNRDNLEAVMCRNTLSVDYQGYLYDCDFNQMLDMPQGTMIGAPTSASCSTPTRKASRCTWPIVLRVHRGAGSSCGRFGMNWW